MPLAVPRALGDAASKCCGAWDVTFVPADTSTHLGQGLLVGGLQQLLGGQAGPVGDAGILKSLMSGERARGGAHRVQQEGLCQLLS